MKMSRPVCYNYYCLFNFKEFKGGDLPFFRVDENEALG